MSYPSNIKHLITLFAKLPGIGPKTSERIVLYLLERHLKEFVDAFSRITGTVRRCLKCHNFSTNEICDICSDSKRNTDTIAVVAKPQDVAAIEQSHAFSGTYHILGGLLSPIEGITDKYLRIKELEVRIEENGIKEIILAFDNNPEGDATANYLKKRLSRFGVRMSRLARGLPMGSDLEYADEITLKSALENRQRL